MSGLETVDIEDFAARVKEDFVNFFTEYSWNSASILAPWINLPFLSPVLKPLLRWAVTFLGTTGGLIGFMINSRIFTTDQGKDYSDTIEKLNSLPEDVSDEEWEKVEREANEAFARLVNYTK